MGRRILWLVICGLMALSLVMTACGPAASSTSTTTSTTTTRITTTTQTTSTTTTPPTSPPTGEAPKYGGVLAVSLTSDITQFDSLVHVATAINIDLTEQALMEGDWTKGNAGGYGTRETDWASNTNDALSLKTGFVAENINWSADVATGQGTIVYKIRQGIHYGLNPKSEASRLVNGRELTADDVVAQLKRTITNDPLAYIYRTNPELKTANITKTGPWEVTVKLPIDALLSGVSRFTDGTKIQPPEVIAKYGNMQDWRNAVGTGPFLLTESTPGSSATLVRNSNFWMTDPIGPGKGNQLPYLDGVQILIIPDRSTLQAAFRSGKLDQLPNQTLEDDAILSKIPNAKKLQWAGNRLGAVGANVNKAPFNDVRVRQAMMMALDFDSINKSLYQGKGSIVTWPISYFPEYKGLYADWNDPDFPAAARDLYTYHPDKAKDLLKAAGYPNGFKTSLILTAADVDYFSIWKDMFAKVGIDFALDVKDSTQILNMRQSGTFDGFNIGGSADAQVWFTSSFLQGTSQSNISRVDDSVINQALTDARLAAVTKGEAAAFKIYRDMVKYTLPLAYAIPRHKVPQFHYYWPWVKNYTGEQCVGQDDNVWPQWVWVDQDLKKSMGF